MMYLNERIDDLQRGGLRVIQRADAFRFGTDAVLLADFAAPRRHDRVCDLGTGTGIIPLLLYARENTISADAVEIQPDMADMAARSMAMNGLNEKIRVLPGDLRSIRTLLPHARYDLVTCNPPYGKAGGTLLNPDASTSFLGTVQGMKYQGKSETEARNMAAISTKGRIQVQATLSALKEMAGWTIYGGLICMIFVLVVPYPKRKLLT